MVAGDTVAGRPVSLFTGASLVMVRILTGSRVAGYAEAKEGAGAGTAGLAEARLCKGTGEGMVDFGGVIGLGVLRRGRWPPTTASAMLIPQCW